MTTQPKTFLLPAEECETCPSCHHTATPWHPEDDDPAEGDLVVCGRCAAIAVLERGELRVADDADLRGLQPDRRADVTRYARKCREINEALGTIEAYNRSLPS